MDDLKQLLAQLAQTEGFDPKAVADAIHEAAPDVYQHVFTSGHSNATERNKPKLTELETQLKNAQAELNSTKDKLKTFGKDNPDVQKEIAKYESALEEKAKRVQDLESELDKTRESSTGAIRSLHSRNFLSSVQQSLVNDYGVIPKYAEFLVQTPDVAERLRHAEDGAVAGAVGRDGVTPVAISGNTTLNIALARELAQGVDKTFITDRRQRGTSLGDNQGSKRSWKASEIDALSPAEYAANRSEINKAMTEGRVVQGA